MAKFDTLANLHATDSNLKLMVVAMKFGETIKQHWLVVLITVALIVIVIPQTMQLKSFPPAAAPPNPDVRPNPPPEPTTIATDSPYIVFNSEAEFSGTQTDGWEDKGEEYGTTLTKKLTYDAYVIRPKLDFSTIDVVARVTPTVNPKTLQDWQDPRSIDSKGYHVARVNFATDRQYATDDNKITFTSAPGNLSYGYCYVSIPPRHKVGVIESPSILRLEFSETPQKHVMILKTELQSYEAFTRDIAWLAEMSKSGNAFVFIHGFNVGFNDAAKRTAQMAYDLNFDGVPIFYSWPSRNSASLTAYEADERNIELSEGNIKEFLVDILSDSKFSNVFVVGHSMGTRGLAKAIGAIAVEKPEAIGKLKAVILAAPDIDADLFKQQIAPRLLKAERSVTLYASSNDRALLASQKLHGYPRAGDSGTGLVILKGVDTIDASNVDTSLLGHSYYGDVRSIIDDMHYLIQESLTVDKRAGLSPAGREPNNYWQFKP
ncbi:alpha/beta hydrolase [Pseudomonas sp. NFX71]|uniref:alpha/beta hydrolase n=1 Tax=Pseudomonas sp. NFX71 TaxID=3399121 RepID=UPI003A83E255